MRRWRLGVLAGVGMLALVAAAAGGAEVVLSDYGPGFVLASGLDQPRLSAVLTDGGSVITDDGLPVVINAFVDTGASGTTISNLHATGYTWEDILGETNRVPSLGLDGVPEGEFIGEFTEIGVGGTETGDVTRLFGLKMANGTTALYDATNYWANEADFIDYGDHSVYVRRAPGVGEIISVLGLELVDPINVIGMSVISQRVMAMDATTIGGEGLFMTTHLLPAGSPELPATNVTMGVRMEWFAPDPLPPGEVLPTYGENPLVTGVSLSHTAAGGGSRGAATLTDQEWLFDTGAGSCFIGLAQAWAVGLIPDGMSLAEFAVQHAAAGGIVLPIGGIGETVDAPLVTVDEIRIDATGAADALVWRNVDILIVDIPGIDGVFGMNLLVPAVTIDPDDPLGSFGDSTPGYFGQIVFDAAAGDLRARLAVDLPGDADGDGWVDDDDLSLVLANWGQTSGWGNGDFTADGWVDDDDLSLLLTYWSGAGGGAAVPEPATMVVIVLGAIAMMLSAGRRRRR